MSDELLYRVRCASDPGIAEVSSVTDAGVSWEGSEGNESRTRHRFLVYADGQEQAIEAVRSALSAIGSFDGWDASTVVDSKGDPWRGAFYRSWDEVNWSAPPARAALTDVERNVLGELLNAGEATWLVMGATGLDRSTTEGVLELLEGRGLVYHTVGPSCEPGTDWPPDRWWAITDEAWDLLGFVKSPNYR